MYDFVFQDRVECFIFEFKQENIAVQILQKELINVTLKTTNKKNSKN